MSESLGESKNVRTVKEYFIRSDAGRADVLELFSDDFEFYFPKFGLGRGRVEFAGFIQGLLGTVRTITHDIETMRFFEGENFVIAEGTTEGTYHDGSFWFGGKTPGGRFCSIYEFDTDGLIRRMHIYLDPDYAGSDTERFVWQGARRW
ncbi:nuclear transport factor 2 family protein [Paraburkholderia sp. EG287A]|uniref:nuclear transport factor 2 family protein n=1 Tax=unclassified Paraburkholderia TaxID=2615204 RepID=UPI0034D1D6E8